MINPKLNIAIGIIILIAQMFVYVNAETVYGVHGERIKEVMLMHFILMALLSPLILKQLMSINFSEVPAFTVLFIITAVFMSVVISLPILGDIITADTIAVALGYGFLHGLTKAFNEEVIWRGALDRMLGQFWSAVTFGLFHFGVALRVTGSMGTAIFSMLFLGMLGFFWSFVKQRFGILGSTGSHFGYNYVKLTGGI